MLIGSIKKWFVIGLPEGPGRLYIRSHLDAWKFKAVEHRSH